MSLEWKSVSKSYNGKIAVNDFSLMANAGELLVLIGPSGCGKSTCLKMINRLIKPDTGTILVDEIDITDIPVVEHRRRIGYVIQQVGLFPHWNVSDNIATVPRLLKWDADRIEKRTFELLDLVGLPPDIYAKAWPNQLSGGEAQRVGVARALAADPPILLMDEPFGAVDPLTREVLQKEFLRIQSELEKTVIFVTHDLDEAVHLSNRIAVMNEGKLVAVAAPENLLLDGDPFVRDFTGDDRILRRLACIRVDDVHNENGMANPVNSGYSIRQDASLKEALTKMLQEGAPNLKVVDSKGTPIGRLTIDDLLNNAGTSDSA